MTAERKSLPLLTPLADIPQGCSLQKSEAGQRFTCVREGDAVHVLADRCPHQGYPLSQGEAREGTLTCAWHNWKFEVSTGECTFGGEGVRRFPASVEDGRVLVDLSVDVPAEQARLTASIEKALGNGDGSAVLRDGLRLSALLAPSHAQDAQDAQAPSLEPAFALLAKLGAERTPYGFDHPLATLCDLVAWVERGWLEGGEALALACEMWAEDYAYLGPRPAHRELDGDGDGDTASPARIVDDLRREARPEAEARVRALARAAGPEDIDTLTREGLLPYVGDHLVAYGHGLIYTDKARVLAGRFPEAREVLFAALSVRLGWGTRETALPPWKHTREGFARVDALTLPSAPAPAGGSVDLGAARGAYEDAVLESEAVAVDATVDALARGVAPRELLRACAHAAARRLARFDPAWERRPDAEVTVLDVSHALTFPDAALSLLEHASPRDAARLTVQAAAFVGKLHPSDRARALASTEPPPYTPDLEHALATRDGDAAGPIARSLEAADRLGVYARLAPFAAGETFVRPIFTAHAVKVTEACHRLERADPEADHAYLEAALVLLLPRRTERSMTRAATLARQMVERSRPPKGLY